MNAFRALVAEKQDDDVVRELRTVEPDELPDGELLVRVAFSSVNYKDALASTAEGQVARISPLVLGIDLAGEVVESSSSDFSEGQGVLAHGYDIGVAHHGGLAEYARIPADWALPLPDGLDPRTAMALGTAGFTAGLSVHALEERGLTPQAGPVLVTGATGGVGSVAVGILAERGFEVHAATGKDSEHDYLHGLGAAEIVSREEVTAESDRPLEKQRWAGAVEPVGGPALAFIMRTLRYGGAVAVSGMTGGVGVKTTVLPLILRGVGVLGADSVNTPMELRRAVWQRLATDLRPRGLEEITHEIELDAVEALFDAILAAGVRGRTVVRIGG